MGHQEINMALSVGLRGARDERGCTRPLRILSVANVAVDKLLKLARGEQSRVHACILTVRGSIIPNNNFLYV